MAITKERLKQLIEQEAVVYSCVDGFVNMFPLEKDTYFGGKFIKVWDYIMDIANLYEHKHDAIHASKYVNMERVEKLSLPFWSEIIKKSGEWSLTFKRYGCEYLLSFIIGDKDKNWISLFINHKNNKKPKFAQLWSSELTQENYTKACEIIKKIWG